MMRREGLSIRAAAKGANVTLLPPKMLNYGKPRLGESTLTYIGLDTPNIA